MALAAITTPPARPSGISVAVIDGLPLFRDALVRLVRQDVALVWAGEAAAAPDAMALLRERRPQIALVDLEFVTLDNVRLLSLAHAERLPTRIVVVASRFDPGRAYELIARGAHGCVTRRAGADELARAIRTVAAGASYLAADVQDAVSREIRLRANDDRPVLSPRELEVLRRISDGERLRAIADAMYLSLSTVKTHVAHLYDKLGVGDRAAAVRAAYRRGLLD
jgi:two-component system, NarL family, nitrate/nitrite response regulator NarL